MIICFIPDCLLNNVGFRYLGHMNTTYGIPCQRWDTNIPHLVHSDYPKGLPDNNVEEAENFCRNPDNELGPWCFTMDIDIEWQQCTIPRCLGESFPKTILVLLFSPMPRYEEKHGLHL